MPTTIGPYQWAYLLISLEKKGLSQWLINDMATNLFFTNFFNKPFFSVHKKNFLIKETCSIFKSLPYYPQWFEDSADC